MEFDTVGELPEELEMVHSDRQMQQVLTTPSRTALLSDRKLRSSTNVELVM